MGLISIEAAAARGIDRLRLPEWVSRFDHIKIDILVDARVGPWVKCYFPQNVSLQGRDPIEVLITDFPSEPVWETYEGPLPESDEYKAMVASFGGNRDKRFPE